MGLRIFHTADLHLGAEYKSFNEKALVLRQEGFNAFKKMVEFVVDPNNGINMMIIAGDLFDTHRPAPALTEKVKTLLKQVVDKDIRLYLLPGNHDSYSYKNSIYRTEEFPGKLIKNSIFELIDEFIFIEDKISIYSGVYDVSQPNKDVFKNFNISSQHGIHIGILHGTLEMREIEVSERDLPFSFEEFAKSKLNYLALGHFHRFFEKSVDENHKLAYCGSIIPRKIDEYNDKYGLVVEIKKGKGIQIDKIPFSEIKSEKKIFNIIKEDIDSFKGLVETIKKTKNPHLILDLIIEGVSNFTIDETLLQKLLIDDFFYLRINNKVKFRESTIITQLKDEETIRGLFFKKLSELKLPVNEQQQRILNSTINIGLKEFTDTPNFDEINLNQKNN